MALTIPATTRARLPAASLAPPGRRPVGTEPNATLVDRQDLTPSVTRFRLRPDAGTPVFRPGQYFAIGLQVAGRFLQRPYSAASTPMEAGELEFLVRLVPGGALTPILWRLSRGARLRLGPPKGLFTMDPGDARQHLFLSTGTGIAPLRSMLGSLLAEPRRSPAANDATRPPIVIHGVATMPELAYRGTLECLASDGRIVYVPAVSRPAHPANRSWRARTGRLDALVEFDRDGRRNRPVVDRGLPLREPGHDRRGRAAAHGAWHPGRRGSFRAVLDGAAAPGLRPGPTRSDSGPNGPSRRPPSPCGTGPRWARVTVDRRPTCQSDSRLPR